MAATTQIGDQGLTLGRTATILAGLPVTVPGFSIDRMCAGAMTAATTMSAGIGVGAYDVAIAAGVEHGPAPDGRGRRPEPALHLRAARRSRGAADGQDGREPARQVAAAHQERADAHAVASQDKTAAAYAEGKIQPDLVPVAIRDAAGSWGSPRSTSRPGPAPPWRAWRHSRRRSARTVESPPATPPASTTAPPGRSWPPRKLPMNSA